ncbi:phosphoserine phosphatase SerB [Propioniciclava sp. MC1595]|uniref:phosphoserine phosphatase SerB n=1 Tax=Propioniciclava sp. MC1595 TaxID=2760308 RepID=UPI0016628B24|nr:phosphoserine phosphatase SerB [Propioniciclava sp. MC1595]MBB1495760.1 phosphoserine phosphatase SerB [Propioniciclava sp. MC1595]NLD75719.1 phosphoserine phosphatase SerB [Acidimicrobiales bacterium]QTE25967.1 phosphoserine phosphatase SerB [Propioniciclava sp. MC1595]
MADLQTLAATLSGPDRPGITHALMSAVAGLGTEVLDLEQVVVRGQVTIALLLGSLPDDLDRLEDRLAGTAARLGYRLTIEEGLGDNPPRPRRVVVTILGRPLRATHLAAVGRVVSEHGGNIDRVRRLSRTPMTTLEFMVSNAEVAALRPALAATAAETGFDVSVSPAGLARQGRRLVVMDVDSTLIRDEVIELLARHAGREAEVAAVTERAMRGELDFAESLHARVATLAGLPVSVFDDVIEAVRLTPGARTLVATLQDLGFAVALVSGGFVEVVKPLAKSLGIKHVAANRLEVSDGVLTGKVKGEVVDRAMKATMLKKFAAAEGLPLSRTVAVGDGANDLDMLAAAGLGIAFNAKPAVRASADTALNFPYLDAVLYLLGFSREEVEDAAANRPPRP